MIEMFSIIMSITFVNRSRVGGGGGYNQVCFDSQVTVKIREPLVCDDIHRPPRDDTARR